jgi:predicted NUDIX family NTP pyrophosphohydrolase
MRRVVLVRRGQVKITLACVRYPNHGPRVRQSAGLLLYPTSSARLEVLLVHPGGPFWARRDEGAWTIPKGEFDAAESPLAAAQREFREETGGAVEGPFVPLAPVRLAGGKRVYAFAVRADFDTAKLQSNRFTIEWPPRSGRMMSFPEIDRAEWFALEEARSKLNVAQRAWVDELAGKLSGEHT